MPGALHWIRLDLATGVNLMFAVMVVGAGRIGASIAKLLHNSGDYEITVADHDAGALERVAAARAGARPEAGSRTRYPAPDRGIALTGERTPRRGVVGLLLRRQSV